MISENLCKSPSIFAEHGLWLNSALDMVDDRIICRRAYILSMIFRRSIYFSVFYIASCQINVHYYMARSRLLFYHKIQLTSIWLLQHLAASQICSRTDLILTRNRPAGSIGVLSQMHFTVAHCVTENGNFIPHQFLLPIFSVSEKTFSTICYTYRPNYFCWQYSIAIGIWIFKNTLSYRGIKVPTFTAGLAVWRTVKATFT